MKIRAQKGSYNTKREFDDFLLKEFSLDKEKFVHDPKLSCNECHAQENVLSDQDSVTSFLIKFKASLLPDPGVIKPGVKGFVVPESGFTINKTISSLLFNSINQNHYEVVLNAAQSHDVAYAIYNDANAVIDISKKEVAEYVINSCLQKEWQALYRHGDRTNWSIQLRKYLREKYKNSYGAFNDKDVSSSFATDPAGIKLLVDSLRAFDFLDEAEDKVLSKHIK